VPLQRLGVVTLPLDGMEALRLADLEGMTHEQAAERMGISRATFGRVVERARRVVAQALVEGLAVKIEGGAVEMTAEQREFQCLSCEHRWSEPFGGGRPRGCPQCGSEQFTRVDRGQGRCHRGRGRGGPRRRGRQTKAEQRITGE
jgi:predicted DNA-binding protein (UPF0251 family)